MNFTLHHGDSRDVIKTIADCSIDSVVTDPPYALVSIVKRLGKDGAAPVVVPEGGSGAYARASRGFMGKQWDTGETAFAVEFWAEVLRVLKPGGHVVSFSGTRTYHRMTCAIEDAGFEIRDQIGWLYGSGFPKSHDVSKGIDRIMGVEAEREITHYKKQGPKSMFDGGKLRPASLPASLWQGWGTALKPAWEPICLARKPLTGTVAANVLEHGTGAINVDECRVGDDGGTAGAGAGAVVFGNRLNGKFGKPVPGLGRWPANIVHDGSEEVLAGFPQTESGSIAPHHKRTTSKTKNTFGEREAPPETTNGDSGSAARFFYTAKADAEDRFGSKHPTVKPVDLIQWLVRLVTPKGGTVLDPFAGTGTTGEAAIREGMKCILIEREEEYLKDISTRMSLAEAGPIARQVGRVKNSGKEQDAGPLFGDHTPPRQLGKYNGHIGPAFY